MRPYSLGGFLTDLPWSIHFVAEAPKLHGVRFFVSVRGSEVAQAGPSRVVAILEIFSRFIGSARSQVYPKHWLRLGQLAPFNKFIGSKSVRLRTEPSEIQTFRSLLDRTDPILPIIARHEIASRITNDRRAKFSNQFEYITSKSVVVRCWVAGLKNAGVNAAAQMLNERPKQTAVQFRKAKIRIDDDLGFIHRKMIK